MILFLLHVNIPLLLYSQDVLFGRGGHITSHPGNQHYRSLVQAQKAAFIQLPIHKSKKEKRTIAHIIFQQIHNVRGRFLMEDCTLGVYNALGGEIIDSSYLPYDKEVDCHPIIRQKVWVQVSYEKAIEKILHRLREKEPTSSSSKDGKSKINNGEKKGDAARGSDNLGGGKTNANIEQSEEKEENVVGQFDSLFDDTAVETRDAGTMKEKFSSKDGKNIYKKLMDDDEYINELVEYDGLLQQHDKNAGHDKEIDIEENNGQCDGLLVEVNAKDNEVGQFDDLFDDTGLQEFREEEEESVGQFDDLFDDDIHESNGPALEEKCGSLDDDDEWSESRLVGHDVDMANEHYSLHELTMSQWVGRWKSKLMRCDTMQTETDPVLGYTKAALPMVLKLTDFLIEAENDEKNGQGNPIPLESIRADNVLIRSNKPMR